MSESRTVRCDGCWSSGKQVSRLRLSVFPIMCRADSSRLLGQRIHHGSAGGSKMVGATWEGTLEGSLVLDRVGQRQRHYRKTVHRPAGDPRKPFCSRTL